MYYLQWIALGREIKWLKYSRATKTLSPDSVDTDHSHGTTHLTPASQLQHKIRKQYDETDYFFLSCAANL